MSDPSDERELWPTFLRVGKGLLLTLVVMLPLYLLLRGIADMLDAAAMEEEWRWGDLLLFTALAIGILVVLNFCFRHDRLAAVVAMASTALLALAQWVVIYRDRPSSAEDASGIYQGKGHVVQVFHFGRFLHAVAAPATTSSPGWERPFSGYRVQERVIDFSEAETCVYRPLSPETGEPVRSPDPVRMVGSAFRQREASLWPVDRRYRVVDFGGWYEVDGKYKLAVNFSADSTKDQYLYERTEPAGGEGKPLQGVWRIDEGSLAAFFQSSFGQNPFDIRATIQERAEEFERKNDIEGAIRCYSILLNFPYRPMLSQPVGRPPSFLRDSDSDAREKLSRYREMSKRHALAPPTYLLILPCGNNRLVGRVLFDLAGTGWPLHRIEGTVENQKVALRHIAPDGSDKWIGEGRVQPNTSELQIHVPAEHPWNLKLQRLGREQVDAAAATYYRDWRYDNAVRFGEEATEMGLIAFGIFVAIAFPLFLICVAMSLLNFGAGVGWINPAGNMIKYLLWRDG